MLGAMGDTQRADGAVWEANQMKLPIDEEFREICGQIVSRYDAEGPSALKWSDDEYQFGAFCGGWDPDGHHGPRFYFSFYAPDGGNYLFSFTLDEAHAVARGGRSTVA